MAAYIATFDVGTTAVKGVLVDGTAGALRTRSIEIPTCRTGGRVEQDPQCWWEAFCAIAREFSAAVGPAAISGVAMSGQMQDLICLDGDLRPVCPAILYADGRAEDQARRLAKQVGEETFLSRTGNRCDGSLPLPKLLWLREAQPEFYAKTAHVLISSKDYVTACLTGVCCGDVTACSTAGAMDIRKKRWDPALLAAADVPARLWPRLLPAHGQAGRVLPAAAAVCGLLPGTPVYAGVGDAGATTLASGITRPGEYNINLGTSGWVATVSDDLLTVESGVFNLAAVDPARYINVVPFLNAGSVHRWIAGVLGTGDLPDYAALSALLAGSMPGSHGVLCLPYLTGERFPVLDADIRGCFAGLTAQTTAADLARACLEGVAFSLRQGLARFPVPPASLSLIGGGGREAVWCQILADVLGQSLTVYRDAETLPALAVAATALLARGDIASYGQFAASLQTEERRRLYRPAEEAGRVYDSLYARFCRLYPALKTV